METTDSKESKVVRLTQSAEHWLSTAVLRVSNPDVSMRDGYGRQIRDVAFRGSLTHNRVYLASTGHTFPPNTYIQTVCQSKMRALLSHNVHQNTFLKTTTTTTTLSASKIHSTKTLNISFQAIRIKIQTSDKM